MVHPDAGVGALDALERLADLERDAALAERPLERLRARLVLGRDEPRERLDDRHVDAEGLPRAGELAADDAAAEDDRGRGHVVQRQRVLAGDHPLAVDVQAGQRLRVGAGGQDDVLPVYRVPSTSTAFGADEAALALDQRRSLRAFDQTLQALVELADDAVLVGVDAFMSTPLKRRLDAELLAPRGPRRRPRRRAAAPWSGCSRGAGRCRRACPSRPGRRTGPAAPRGTRPRSRRCRRPGSGRRRSWRVGSLTNSPR